MLRKKGQETVWVRDYLQRKGLTDEKVRYIFSIVEHERELGLSVCILILFHLVWFKREINNDERQVAS